MKSLYEQMVGIYYLRSDGMLYPKLLLLVEDEHHDGKNGCLRLGAFTTGLLLSGKLNTHLNEIADTAFSRWN